MFQCMKEKLRLSFINKRFSLNLADVGRTTEARPAIILYLGLKSTTTEERMMKLGLNEDFNGNGWKKMNGMFVRVCKGRRVWILQFCWIWPSCGNLSQ